MKSAQCCLLIEDDPEDQEFFINALHSISSTTGCYAVSNGEEALSTLTNEGLLPDYIFTDLHMPKMNGLEFLMRLRQIERFRNTPVIVYTSDFTEEHKRKAELLGVTAIYSKSKMSKLKDMLRKYFEEDEQETDSATV